MTAHITLDLRSGDRPCLRDELLYGRLVVASPKGVRAPSRLLLESLANEMSGRILVVGSPQALVALSLRRLRPDAETEYFTHEAFEVQRAHATARRNGIELSVHFGADLPGIVDSVGRYDWVILGVSRTGERQLASEFVAQACAVLRRRGKLLAAIDDRRDRWLRGRIEKLFGAATVLRSDRAGTVYVARSQTDRAPRVRPSTRLFTARLFDTELALETCAGVFSHGRLDEGTLALSEVADDGVRERSRVLDFGCGSGALGIAAARRARSGCAVLVDSNARAARAARTNVERNGVEANTLVLPAYDLGVLAVGAVDRVLANPPYFGDYRISELFVRESWRVLAPGGRLYLVTKSPERHFELLAESFGEEQVEAESRRGYTVLVGEKA